VTPPAGRLRGAIDDATLERIGLFAILVMAVVLRFVNLSTRGTFDADQGHDMRVLHDLVASGQIPLLGPPTSIGDFHHGVLYYFLLAPAAWLSGSDPLGVTAAIALAGVLAVAVVWWLARSIGGPVAGAVAGLLMAVSSSAVDESTFIWNPNLIALSSAIALAAAWRAWSTDRAAWWIVAAAGAVVTMQCHVLGSILLVPIGGLLLADARRRGPGPERRAILRAGGLGILLLALSYLPLAVHELGSDFSETRAAIAFATGGAEPSAVSLPVRFGIVAWRVLAWPLAGLVTAAPLAAMVAMLLVVASLLWRAGRAGGASDRERIAVRWIAASLAWTIVALTVAASSLATVIPGLPNDHYHAFADPMVFVVVGLGIAGLARWRGPDPANDSPTSRDWRRWRGRRTLGPAAAVGLTLAVVGFNLVRQPPAVAFDGGWPAAEAAAARALLATGERPIRLAGLPVFKSTEAMAFPLLRLGRPAATLVADPATPPGDAATVVMCDALFNQAIGADCGGPAEDVSVEGAGVSLVDRFEAAPGRWVSIYLPG
jgi:4-amino-4-deoxy-L-arabinose transferase-like glycosyltransferase